MWTSDSANQFMSKYKFILYTDSSSLTAQTASVLESEHSDYDNSRIAHLHYVSFLLRKTIGIS